MKRYAWPFVACSFLLGMAITAVREKFFIGNREWPFVAFLCGLACAALTAAAFIIYYLIKNQDAGGGKGGAAC